MPHRNMYNWTHFYIKDLKNSVLTLSAFSFCFGNDAIRVAQYLKRLEAKYCKTQSQKLTLRFRSFCSFCFFEFILFSIEKDKPQLLQVAEIRPFWEAKSKFKGPTDFVRRPNFSDLASESLSFAGHVTSITKKGRTRV